jgi:hypothetical protein
MRRYEGKADAEHPLDIQRPPARVTAQAPPGNAPRSSTELLRLQRLVGNRAVSSLIANGPRPATSRLLRAPAHDRKGGADRSHDNGLSPQELWKVVEDTQRSAGNRAVRRLLARVPGGDVPTDAPLTLKEMWEMVLAKRGLESRVPPHGVREAEERDSKAQERAKAEQERLKAAKEKLKEARDVRRGQADPEDERAREGTRKARQDLKGAKEDAGKAAKEAAEAAKHAESRRRNRSEPVPKGTGVNKQPLGHGTQTFGAIQITDQNGRRVAFALASYRGGLHAEEAALQQIREELLRKGIGVSATAGKPGMNWRVTIVVDQSVCADRCRPALRQFADDFGIDRKAVVAHYPERVAGDAPAKPKGASRSAHHRPVTLGPGEQVLAGGSHPHRLEGGAGKSAPPQPPPPTKAPPTSTTTKSTPPPVSPPVSTTRPPTMPPTSSPTTAAEGAAVAKVMSNRDVVNELARTNSMRVRKEGGFATIGGMGAAVLLVGGAFLFIRDVQARGLVAAGKDLALGAAAFKGLQAAGTRLGLRAPIGLWAGLGFGFLSSLPNDQGARAQEETERAAMAFRIIHANYPGILAYVGNEYCLWPFGWPCIEVDSPWEIKDNAQFGRIFPELINLLANPWVLDAP